MLSDNATDQRTHDILSAAKDKKQYNKGFKTRQAIMAYILAMPGCTLSDLKNHLNINGGQVSVFVRELKKFGVIKSDKEDGKHGARLYFFNQNVPAGKAQKEQSHSDEEYLTKKTGLTREQRLVRAQKALAAKRAKREPMVTEMRVKRRYTRKPKSIWAKIFA